MIQEARLIDTFCNLVRIDSPSGEEEAIAQDLQQRLVTLGFTTTRDAHGNLIAREEGSNPLLLSAHMDTVEPGRGIKPRIVDGQIVSDGTTILGGDCKAGIAAILEALQSIQENQTNRIPVQLVFTRGEEIGLVGARNLDLTLITAKEGVIFDGNGPVNKITVASPTYMSFDIKVTGQSAHAGVEPEKGLSAIKIAAHIITQLRQGRIDDETTMNIGTIIGGSVRNAVPETACFSGEFRSRNVETLDLLQLQIFEVMEQTRHEYPDAIINMDMNQEFQRYSLSENDPMVNRVTKVLANLGFDPMIGPSGGGTDANVLNRQGIRCVVVGMSTREMHTTREYVPVSDLIDTARFCETLLREPD